MLGSGGGGGAGVMGSCEWPDVGAGIEAGSTARILGTLNHWCLSPAPVGSFLND